MPEIMLFVSEAPGTTPFRVHAQNHKISRVPMVGEHIALGNDARGIPLDYRAEIVRHIPEGVASTSADAEVYAVRVSMPQVILAAAPKARWQSPLES